MQSLILLTKNNPSCRRNLEEFFNKENIAKILPRLIDCTTCTDIGKSVFSICNFSNITDEEYVNLFSEQDIVNVFIKVIAHIPHEELRNIEFDKFTEIQQQHILNIMLENNLSVDLICLLLDKMKSLNYGTYANISYSNNNPLLYCCCYNKLDFVKLLVKYGANIDHENSLGKTGIMYAYNNNNNTDIIRYLYSMGAKLSTDTNSYYETRIIKIIKSYEETVESQERLEKFKSDYENTILDLKLRLKESEEKYTHLKDDYDTVNQKYIKISEFISSIYHS